MIDQEKRKMIERFVEEGKTKKEISRFLEISIKTVRNILKETENFEKIRKDKLIIEKELLMSVYERCDKFAERTHEILREEHNVDIGYSTLTRLLREYGLCGKKPKVFIHVPDVPGDEMQHDTSVYVLLIGGKKTKVVLSGLYFRYSKMRYLEFFHYFRRFQMKCFFFKALTFFKYCCKVCIIDNTNLARYSGSGSNATFVLEMVTFAKNFGFIWKAHAIGHANRKGGKERNFWTVETNFFPGRSFASIEDLNKQVFDWATVRYAQRPQSKTNLIPANLFEYEKSFLLKVPPFISEPLLEHERITDAYGYVAFDANFYWTPLMPKNVVKIIEYSDCLKLHFPKSKHEPLEYRLPPHSTRLAKFSPPGMPVNRQQPNNLKKDSTEEEKRLRVTGSTAMEYLDFIHSSACCLCQKSKFIRDLYSLSKKMTDQILQRTLARALKYKIDNIPAIEKIAGQFLISHISNSDADEYSNLEISDIITRATYDQGRISTENSLEQYDKYLENADSDNAGENL